MIKDNIHDVDKIHTLITRKGWTYRVQPGSYDDDGEAAWFLAATRGVMGWDRVVIRLDEIATIVEGSE